jgi:hypothetical protein
MAADNPSPAQSNWLIEQYLPSAGEELLRRHVALMRATVTAFDPTGDHVRIVAVTIVPDDEAVLCLVEAPTEMVVREVCERAGVPFDRISHALAEFQ